MLIFHKLLITRMVWPANSPDLNPIEDTSDYPNRSIKSRGLKPHNLETLRMAILDKWGNIPLQYFRDLFPLCQDVR